jgi:DNA-binding IclR family transcriptional regulator
VIDVMQLVERLRGTFLEMPGTRVSVSQAARLTGVEPSLCHEILEILTHSHFLKSAQDGTFMLR